MNKIWETTIKLDDVELKNRIVFPPINPGLANIDGSVSDALIKWYNEIAKGGCGMIVVEGTAVAPEGKGAKRSILFDEEHLSGLELLMKTIKENNCFASIQLLHAGGQANPDFTGYEAVSPSKMESNITGTGHTSRELKIQEIEEIREKFINSAVLASKAGFQAVELHLAHGYLLHEFLSEHTNKRKDKYGGNLENRARLVLEIIEKIREKLPQMIIGVRVSGEDYLKDGINEEVNRKLLPIFEKAGVRYFSVSAGTYETSKVKHEAMKKGEFFDYAKGIKNIINKPVIGVGKILDLESAEKHLQNKDCDLVAIGRGLVADPAMIKKIKNNQSFNRCTECGECRYLALGKESLSCPVKMKEINKMKLENKIALITGGSGGIGKAIAKTFLKEGAKVVIAAKNKKKLEDTVKELKYSENKSIKYIQTDVSKPKEVKNLIEQIKLDYGKIDILVNAAAIQSPIGPFLEIDLDEAIKNIETNFIGTMLTCKYVLPIMIQNKKGKIINFSGGGSLSSRPNFSIYGSAKTAVIRFTETLAEEVKKYGVYANVMAPGSVDTGMVTEILNLGQKAGEKAIKEAERVRKTGGTGVEPAVELAVFLASDASDNITGKLISAPWDDWKNFNKRIKELKNSSLYTLRRIDGRTFSEEKVVENLIIKTSYSKLPNGELKSNLGDLVKSPILLSCIKGDYLWLTDSRSKDLLKYFVDPEKIISIEDISKSENIIKASAIYNIDNYVADERLFNKIKGKWHGYVWDGQNLSPENNLIEAMAPYGFSKINKSWQQLLIEGMGFEWKEQDYFVPKINKKESIDIGLNWHVHPEWKSKRWPKENWEEVERILKKNYSVSWQQGLNDFDEYINWLSSCKLIITCETLGLHLASALRKKVLTIIGPVENNEFSYGRVTYIKPEPKDCMPCNSPECKFGDSCLNEITPKKLSEIATNMFKNK